MRSHATSRTNRGLPKTAHAGAALRLLGLLLWTLPVVGWVGLGCVAPEPSAVDAGWQARVQQALAEREYRPSRNRVGLQAPNRAHNFRTYFEASGIRVHDRTAAGSPELLGLSVTGLGRGETLAPVAPGEVVSEGARVEIRRPGLLEWYENSPAGLEQGFTLAERPGGEGALLLEVGVKGARASLRGDRILFETPTQRRLTFGKLAAVDARGANVPASFAVPDTGRLRIVLADSGAVYPLTVDPLLTETADTLLESDQETAWLGYSVAGAGDVNADGYDDVIVGAIKYDAGEPDEGAAFVFLGSASGVADGGPATAAAQLESDQAGAALGSGVAGAGDVNGDGYDDVIVGAFFYRAGEQTEGAAFVFLGSASGIADGNPTTAAAQLESDQASAQLGRSVAGAGDVNRDGYDDVIVGAEDYSAGETEEGAAFVFLGSASGIADGNPATADARLESNQAYALFGISVSGAGDVNGDGYDDVIVGSNAYTAGETWEGAAFVFLGSASGVADGNPGPGVAQLESNQALALLGSSVAGAGDVNGDGYDDVIVGARDYFADETDEGAAFVFLGSGSGIADGNPTTAAAQLESDQAGAHLGTSVAGAGDVNGDGYDDVIVGAWGYDAGESYEGAAFVFLGSALGIVDGNPTTAAAQLESNRVNGWLGQTDGVAGAGDVNGDGYDDVIVGAYVYDPGETNVGGTAFVYLGTPGKRVCYYDLGFATVPSEGNPNQPPAIVDAGHFPVFVDSLDSTLAEFCDVLFAQNPNDSGYAAEWTASLAAVDTAVQNGMVLVFHDRNVAAAAASIPGLGAATCVRDFSDPANIEKATAGTSTTHGPQGFVTDTNLDGFGSSSHGYCDASTLPARSQVVLSRTSSNEATTLSYRHGSGAVVYSTIPLDQWLSAAPNAMSDVYAPNVVQYGVDLIPANVCYYDLGFGPGDGGGDPTQVPAILTAGHRPVDISEPDAEQLANCDVLLAQNPNNGGYASDWTANLTDIDAAVFWDGMVLVFHDRYVTDAANQVPGLFNSSCTRSFDDGQNIDVQDDDTSVTHGPGGTVDDSTLDGFGASNHGFCADGSLPNGARSILSRTAPAEATTLSYRHGSGAVVYSTIPLDHWLSVPPNAMSEIYAPNVTQYGVDLLAKTVCYYDLVAGQGNPSEIAPITAAGHLPLDISAPEATQTWRCDVLFAQNPSNGGYPSEWVANLADVDAAVRDGTNLVFHDRNVTDATLNIPGLGSATCVRETFLDTANIEVVDDTTVVTDGPGGIVDDTTLDGFSLSSHGYCPAASLPPASLVILSRTLASEAATMAYPLGAGGVVYSTIPLDAWLLSATTMRDIYAPNVVGYAALPEPLGSLQLIAGLTGLLALARLRRRSGKAV